MHAISLNMRRAAPIRQDVAAHSRVPLTGQVRKDFSIMTQSLALAISDTDRGRADSMADAMLRTALEIVQAANETALGILSDANELCTATGVNLPPRASELYAYLLPRQVVAL